MTPINFSENQVVLKTKQSQLINNRRTGVSTSDVFTSVAYSAFEGVIYQLSDDVNNLEIICDFLATTNVCNITPVLFAAANTPGIIRATLNFRPSAAQIEVGAGYYTSESRVIDIRGCKYVAYIVSGLTGTVNIKDREF